MFILSTLSQQYTIYTLMAYLADLKLKGLL